MTLRDLLEMSAGNLWRLKLRTLLTVAGVVIAIGAFVAMVSFGAGAQQNVQDEYENLGLFTTMQVSPAGSDTDSLGDTIPRPPLDDSAVAMLARLPGVRLAYPFDAFSIDLVYDTFAISTEAQALSDAALQTRMFSQLRAGRRPDTAATNEALITGRLIREHDLPPPDSLIGKQIIVSVASSTIDSALINVLRIESDRLDSLVESFDLDSLENESYLRRVATEEFNSVARSFLDGYLNRLQITSDTLTIAGVIDQPGGHRVRIKPIIIPRSSARKFIEAKGGPSPVELLSALQSGRVEGLFGGDSGPAGEYSRVTLDLDPGISHAALSDSIETLGFETFSYMEQFAEMQRFFLYFDLVLGIVGLIALTTASLGIVNTMVMSTIERRREIGVLKSLGADDRHIWLQFLVESGVIGAVGSVFGIALGWVVTRVVALIAKHYMENEGIPPIDPFALPIWLILTALLFGTAVSIAAGLYPAARAARVDPVEALRNE